MQRGTEPVFLTGAGGMNKAAAIQATQQPTVTRPLHEAWGQIDSLLSFYLRGVFAGNERAVYACRDLRPVVDGVLAGLEDAQGAGRRGATPGQRKGRRGRSDAMIIVMQQGRRTSGTWRR